MAHLRSKLPPGSSGGAAQVQLQPGSTVASVLEELGLGDGYVHLVVVNGVQESDRGRVLHEGDEIVVFPPVAGGQEEPPGRKPATSS